MEILCGVGVLLTAGQATPAILEARVVCGDLLFQIVAPGILLLAERAGEVALKTACCSACRSPASPARAPIPCGDELLEQKASTRLRFGEIEALHHEQANPQSKLSLMVGEQFVFKEQKLAD